MQKEPEGLGEFSAVGTLKICTVSSKSYVLFIN